MFLAQILHQTCLEAFQSNIPEIEILYIHLLVLLFGSTKFINLSHHNFEKYESKENKRKNLTLYQEKIAMLKKDSANINFSKSL